MAEAAGLAFAVLGAFNDAVQCFEYIQLARSFDRDFQTATLKLAISRLRLSRWGQSVGLDQVTESDQSLVGIFTSPQDLEKAEEMLRHIFHLSEEARTMSAKLQSTNTNPATYEAKDFDEATTSLEQKLSRLSMKRFKPSHVLNATKWALHQDRYLNRLIDDTKDLVDGLVELFPAAQSARRQFCEEDGAELASDTQVSLLKPFLADQESELDEAIRTVELHGGNTYNTTFAGSTNHGLQQAHNSAQQTNYFGGKS
jgi:Prion-inhibition and propagation/SesB domain on fungal death-pathway protein